MKNNKGITLIALVVTIIVLLILAGVSIAMLTGDNGILSRAQDARDNSAQGSLDEATKIAIGNIMTTHLEWPDGVTFSGTKTATGDNKDLVYEIKNINSSLTNVTGKAPEGTKKVATITAQANGKTQTVYVNVETGAVVDAAD